MVEGYIFVGHYLPRIVPALCCIYFVFVAYGGRAGRALVPMGLFTIACVLLWPNVTIGLYGFQSAFRYRHDLERDLRAGIPPFILAERYARDLTGHDKPEMVAAFLRKLKRDNIGEFRHMQPDPVFIEIPVPIKPSSWHELTWEDGVGYAKGKDPHLVFALRQPEQVHAIRFKLAYPSTKGQTALLQVFWRHTEKNDFAEGARAFTTTVEAVPDGRTVTVWVNDTIDQFRIDPDTGPSVFTISDLRVLVPRTR